MDDTTINVLVTGASRGLGRALAERLAERGARVVLVARHERPLNEAVDAIRAAGGDAHALVADVADEDAAARIVGAATAMIGPIDLLVNNASTLGPVPLAPLVETRPEELERAFAVNLVAPFRLARAVVGQMIERGRGTVLHVSSDAAVSAYPTWGAYGASKAALDHLARVWAEELDGTGVRVIGVDPGEMDTVMHADAIPDADPATLARAEDVARAIVERLVGAENGERLAIGAAEAAA